MLATANTGKHRERFWKNAGEWTGRVEISEEEIPGSKRSMYGKNLPTPERLSSVFSPDGTLISASAVPHCGVDPLHWFPVATDRIARLGQKVDRGLNTGPSRDGSEPRSAQFGSRA